MVLDQSGYKLYCCGSRGSRTVEGHYYDEFGGFTSCYILKKEEYALVIDCGTGFYAAGPLLTGCSVIDVVLTHMHYDHILGMLDWGKMPSSAKVTCYSSFDEWFGDDTLKEFMKKPFWPVTPEFNIKTVDDQDEIIKLNNDDLSVQFYPAPHPDGAKILIITKGEISDDHNNQIVVMADCERADGLPEELIRGCNLLIYDGMYSDDEYTQHSGWGHSTWQEGVRLASRIGCKKLIITHHEPNRTDVTLREFEREARKKFPRTNFARAGQIWEFPFDPQKGQVVEPAPESRHGFREKIKSKVEFLISRLMETASRKKDVKRIACLASCSILGGVSVFMTIVNVSTGKNLLMLSTLVFAVLCAIDDALVLFAKAKPGSIIKVFALEIVALFSFFIITGTPEGFSIVWTLLLPTAGLFVFGTKFGSILCAIMMAIMVFFLQTPVGQSLIMYEYSDSFKLRFPMAFVAFYLMSLFLETLRHRTSLALTELQAKQDKIISRQTASLRDQNFELMEFNTKLELRNKLLNKTFGRFLPDEVVEGLLNTTDGFELFGRKTLVTVLQSDIRGFTSISGIMEPMELVNMLNHYLGIMTEIVQKHNGNVVEFIGDGIMAIFGAPNENPDHADDAIACAVEMQAVMKDINEWNAEKGYEHFEIGIGIHTGDAVVGTIGSEKHLKYDVIGNTVNLASRIESYSTGGQVIVSAETLKYVRSELVVEGTRTVMPKGSNEPMVLSSIIGIGGDYNISCPAMSEKQTALKKIVNTKFVFVREGHCEMNLLEGEIIADSEYAFTIKTDAPLEMFDDIRIECGCGLIGKIIGKNGNEYLVRYTSKPSKFKGFDKCACSESEKYFSFKLN